MSAPAIIHVQQPTNENRVATEAAVNAEAQGRCRSEHHECTKHRVAEEKHDKWLCISNEKPAKKRKTRKKEREKRMLGEGNSSND